MKRLLNRALSTAADVTVDARLNLSVRSSTGEEIPVQLTRSRAQRLARALNAYALEEKDAEPQTTIEARELPSRETREPLRGYLHRSMSCLV